MFVIMKIAIVKIFGLIGTYLRNGKEEKGISLVDVIAQMKGQSIFDKILIEIDSPGGDPDLAFQATEYLKSFKKPIDTLINGQCASSATIFALAGEKRMIVGGISDFFVHNPSLILNNFSGDADALNRLSDHIRQDEDKMAKYYAKATGLSVDGVYPLMKSETSLTPEEALTLGFVTNIITPEEAKAMSVTVSEKKNLQPIAFYQSKNKSQNPIDMSDTKKIQSTLDLILTKLNLKKAASADKKALDWKTTDATPIEVTFETEAEVPAVDDVATVGGDAAPDGTYNFENGVVVVITGGKVASVTEAAAETEAVKKLTLTVAALTKENGILKAAALAKEAQFTSLEKQVALIGKTIMASDFKIPKGGFDGNKGDEEEEKPRNDFFAKKKAEMIARKKAPAKKA